MIALSMRSGRSLGSRQAHHAVHLASVLWLALAINPQTAATRDLVGPLRRLMC